MTTDQQPVSDRAISMSVREARMYVGRILLTCGLPSGYAPAVTECVLTSQAAGCGGFAALLQCHAQLRMTEFSRIGVAEIDVHALEVDGAGLHAWLLAPTLLDLAVDLARRHGQATLHLRNVGAPGEFRILCDLARRHGARAKVAIKADSTGHTAESGREPVAAFLSAATLSVSNDSPPRTAQRWDPLLLAALEHGYLVTESLWRDLHALSNGALAEDSVVSRRHAGPVILQDDGTVLGRQPSDDDYDPNMLRSVVSPTP